MTAHKGSRKYPESFQEAVIGFKIAIVTSDNVASSIFRLSLPGRDGTGWRSWREHCVQLCEGIDN